MKYPTGTFSSRGSVVTVPCYFKAHQMDNTRKAAEMADINCTGIIQEPIAAALTYALQICEDHFDKGVSARKFSSLISAAAPLILPCFNLSIPAIPYLLRSLPAAVTTGWVEWTSIDAWRMIILGKSGVSLDGVEHKLRNKAQKNLLEQSILAKIALSASNDYYVAVPFILPDKHIEVSITREEFEKSIKHYLDKISNKLSMVFGRNPI